MNSENTMQTSWPRDAVQTGPERASQLDAIYRKITWRLVPFLFIVWLMAWIDRVNVGFTKLQMNSSLGFSEAVYGLGAGLFFVGYFFFEVPSNLALQRFGARKTIARIAIGWGLTCIALTLITTSTGFYVIRFILGAFEAGFWPGVILYVTYWFPATRSAKVLAIINAATATSGIISGPLAGTIMDNMNGLHGWAGWQWVFVIEGVPSILLGVAAFWVLSDKPEQARWLTDHERQLLKEDLERDRAVIGAREHSFARALKDTQIWIFALIYFCMIMGQAALIFWAPTIVKELGFASTTNVGYIISVVYLIGLIAMVSNGVHSDRSKEARLHTGIPVLIGAVGCAVLGILVMLGSKWAILALCIAHPAILASIPVFWQLPNKMLVGTAAAAGIAMINSLGNLAGFASPFLMGVVKDATGQITMALWLVAAIVALGAILVLTGRSKAQVR